MIVTIHQPNFCPWLPFFEKMARADLFVLLTECQYEKNGYQNRFRYADQWYTMSTARGLSPICTKHYLNPEEDWERIKHRLPQFDLGWLDECLGQSLAHTNLRIIEAMARRLGIATPIVEDFPTEATGTDRLVELCQEYGATTYLSGPSGKRYLDLDKFDGICVDFFEATDKRHAFDAIAIR
jgi:hypothetical protein